MGYAPSGELFTQAYQLQRGRKYAKRLGKHRSAQAHPNAAEVFVQFLSGI
jgi:hypothetical protein